HPEHHQQQQPAPPAAASAGPVNHTVLAMRDKVRDMMRFAWTSYERYAWGMNELRPVSKIGHTTTIFGNEFKKARDWIKDNLQFDKDTQLAKITTGQLGAAPSCLKLALCTWNLPPLSEITGNSVYLDKANKPNGLYPNYIHPSTASWCQQHSSLAGLGDSFYEYLIKEWLRSGKSGMPKPSSFSDESLPALSGTCCAQATQLGCLYLADVEIRSHSGEERWIIWPALPAVCSLWALTRLANLRRRLRLSTSAEAFANKWIQIWRQNYGNLSGNRYERTAVKLGPESFRFDSGVEAVAVRVPENGVHPAPRKPWKAISTCWRLNARSKYSRLGLGCCCAHFETYCRAEAGYSGLRDVYSPSPGKDDVTAELLLG
uniref:SCP domain-containing protein n=1 Tax=Macrostomum lignano TaxID=282301 RepID=A0A1I8F6G9_9PLAT